MTLGLSTQLELDAVVRKAADKKAKDRLAHGFGVAEHVIFTDGVPADDPPSVEAEQVFALRGDPLAMLSAAAGYDDPERWWDDVIESRSHLISPFDAITEAMTELRLHSARPRSAAAQLREDQREAQMRQVLRDSLKRGARRVAVVCGAWHAPALTGKLPPASADAKLLRGLPKHKMQLTWVPWTHSRLSQESGYGAGVASPGWYQHLFSAPDQPITRWMTKVARVLRARDMPISSAHVIEGVRLAEALATVRNRPLAGLDEVTEATRAVLCDGDDVSLNFVTRDLVVGEAMGSVPLETPAVPLATDLTNTARRLRLKLEPFEKLLTLDLRRPNDLEKSLLLHRLRAIGIDWGEPDEEQSRSTGTFREGWVLCWQPEFAVDIIDASMWGTTVGLAATAKLIDKADTATTLGAVAAAVEQALVTALPAALPAVLSILDARAALDHDVRQLMSAVPPLVRAARYGDVRSTDATGLNEVIDALLLRICAGLPAAVGSLADYAADELRTVLDDLHSAILLRGSGPGAQPTRRLWYGTLAGLVERRDLHGLLAGRMVRLLLDGSVLDTGQAAARLRRALSLGPTVAAKAMWAQGFLSEDGLLLVHNLELLGILDEWLTGLSDPEFTDAVVLLRRTFGAFAAPERATIGEQARRLGRPSDTPSGIDDFDVARSAAAVATVAELLGLTADTAREEPIAPSGRAQTTSVQTPADRP